MKSSTFFVMLGACLGLTATTVATPEAVPSSDIIMKSPSAFMVNDREVTSENLVKALKKNKISPDLPMVIEVPANTPLGVIKELTQRLATAGYKPFFKYPRHADATVRAPHAPAPIPPPKKQRWRK